MTILVKTPSHLYSVDVLSGLRPLNHYKHTYGRGVTVIFYSYIQVIINRYSFHMSRAPLVTMAQNKIGSAENPLCWSV